MKASTYDYKIIRGKWLIYCKYGQGVIFTTNQSTCPVPSAFNTTRHLHQYDYFIGTQ